MKLQEKSIANESGERELDDDGIDWGNDETNSDDDELDWGDILSNRAFERHSNIIQAYIEQHSALEWVSHAHIKFRY